MTMTLRLLEQALVLGETSNYARAAERLGISQPTLSRNMAALESNLGVRLFDRGRGGAAPTVFGEVVIDRAAALLNDVNALRSELRALAGMDAGQLNIAAGPFVAEDLVAPAVARLVNEHPGLRVRVTVVLPDEVGAEVRSRRHELGLGGIDAQAPHEELSVVALAPRRLYLACRAGHPLASSRPPLDQVLSFPVASVRSYGPLARIAASGSGAGSEDLLHKAFAPALEVNSMDTAKRIVRESDALLPATASMLASELSSGSLVRLAFDLPDMRVRPALIRLRERTPSPAALRFLALLRTVEAELVAAERAEHGDA